VLPKKFKAARPGDVGAHLVVACPFIAMETVLRAGIDENLDVGPLGLDRLDAGAEKFVQAEIVRWGAFVKASGIKSE
jgi:hypothetical protein